MASGVGKEDFSSLRWTIDTVDDYKLVSEIYEFFGNNLFRYEDILHAYKEHPEWVEINLSLIHI